MTVMTAQTTVIATESKATRTLRYPKRVMNVLCIVYLYLSDYDAKLICQLFFFFSNFKCFLPVDGGILVGAFGVPALIIVLVRLSLSVLGIIYLGAQNISYHPEYELKQFILVLNGHVKFIF